MRVVFIENENLSRDSSGGVMSYIINIANYLKGKNIESIIIGIGEIGSNTNNSDFSNSYTVSKDTSISNFKFFIKLFFTNQLKNINSNDIIHVQRPEMVIPIATRTINKIVCTLHGGQDLAVFKKKGFVFGLFYSFLQFISFLLVDYLIAVDNKNKDRYLKKYSWIKNKIKVIPISVNINKYYPRSKIDLRIRLGYPLNSFILLFVGRLESEKNVDFLIDSFKLLNIGSDYKLLIIGDGSQKKKLEDIVSNPNQNIFFLGELANSKIPEFINIADVLCLTSSYEGSPTVIKEALCCNVPVISTDVGDVKEVLNHIDCGVIISKNTKSFLKAVKEIQSKNDFNFIKAQDLFNHKTMGLNTLNVYKSI